MRKEATKPKRQPKNFFLYFLDEYILFRRDFYFESKASPETLLKAIMTLEGNITSSWIPHGRIVPTYSHFNEQLLIEIVTQARNRVGFYWDIAKARGVISKISETSSLEGSVIVRGSWLWVTIFLFSGFGLGLTVFIEKTLTYPEPLIYLSLWGLIIFLVAVLWYPMYSNRNRLLKLIQNAVESTQ